MARYESKVLHGTTIISVRCGGKVAMGGDRQVSLGETIVKTNASKIRLLYSGTVLAGFAGATADALTLLELFESKLETYQGQLARSAVELVRDWRSDKILRRLEAALLVADKDASFMITGCGDVLEPEGGLMAVGSGGDYAKAAAQALLEHTRMGAERIVKASLHIAADMCVYTNHQYLVEVLSDRGDKRDR